MYPRREERQRPRRMTQPRATESAHNAMTRYGTTIARLPIVGPFPRLARSTLQSGQSAPFWKTGPRGAETPCETARQGAVV